jgi:hypothetical protein
MIDYEGKSKELVDWILEEKIKFLTRTDIESKLGISRYQSLRLMMLTINKNSDKFELGKDVNLGFLLLNRDKDSRPLLRTIFRGGQRIFEEGELEKLMGKRLAQEKEDTRRSSYIKLKPLFSDSIEEKERESKRRKESEA